MEPIPSNFNFNNIKVIAFMEVSPLSDEFEPIALTFEQSVKLMDLLESFMKHPGPGEFQVVTNSSDKITIPNIRDYYTSNEIEEMRKKGEAGTFI